MRRFTIDATTGEVTLTGNPTSRRSRATASTVTATDGAGNDTTQTVTLAINNLDEVAPKITSGATAAAINENSGAGQVVYTATADRPGDGQPVRPGELQPGRHRCGAFTIDATPAR